MRVVTVIIAGFLTIISAAPVGADIPAGAGRGKAGTLPETLNAFYPSVAGRPIYLTRMLDLETSFSGIVVDLMEDDIAGARSSFEDFAGKYREVAGIVPEWKGKYPEQPVKELGAALAAGDRKRSISAFAEVGTADEVIALAGKVGRESCCKCHLVHLPAAFAGAAGR